MHIVKALAAIGAAIVLASCSSQQIELTDEIIADANADVDSNTMPEYAKWSMDATSSGIGYVELKPGDGAAPKAGNEVRVHYTLWLTDGSIIDTSRAGNRPTPFSFTIGEGRVIEGWDEVLRLMRPGSRFLVEIPPKLGYGSNAVGPIPKNSKLVFAIDLFGFR